jgi:hypothetical protein
MQPFDLDKALAGQKVITETGREILEIAYFRNRKEWPVLVLLNDNQTVYAYNTKGEHATSVEELKLFMVPTKKTYFINIYRYSDGLICPGIKCFQDRNNAIEEGLEKEGYLTTIEFEIEE